MTFSNRWGKSITTTNQHEHLPPPLLDQENPIWRYLTMAELVIDEILATICSANKVFVGKHSFLHLSSYLEKIIPVIEKIMNNGHDHDENMDTAVKILRQQVKLAKALAEDCCGSRSRIYLLVNCRRVLKPLLESIAKEIGRALSLLALAGGASQEIEGLSKKMMLFEYYPTADEEKTLNKIDLGIQERNFTRSYANSLLALIADAAGISKDRMALKRELDEFKVEVDSAESRVEDMAEAVRMDQIVSMLEKADATLSFKDKEFSYSRRRNALGSRAVEPLQSFYCAITGEIMVDPVEISSGQTFERRAIEKWIADGNTTCPLTMTTLNNVVLRPNVTLRKSIEEWKERNAIIRIASIKLILESGDEEEMVRSLGHLQKLCEEKELYREYVVLENCLKILVGLLGRSNRAMRHRALSILTMLAKDGDDVKELISDVDNAIESIVCSLARQSEERKLAVALLLELSKFEIVREHIGTVHGCILLLVTISNSDNNQAASDARELLESLSFLDENVVQMAKANFFKPLLQRLHSGSDVVKKIMVTTLAEMELTDHSKAGLFHDGVLEPLLRLISHDDADIRLMAIKSLQCLSSLQKNGLQMIRERAVRPLLDLLRPQVSSSTIPREPVALILMNIAKSVSTAEADESLEFLESDDDISWLFSLVIVTGPEIQCNILQMFYALSRLPSAKDMRNKLRQFSAIRALIPLCEHADLVLRANAVKLLSCLVEAGQDSLLSADAGQRFLHGLLSVIDTSSDEEEVAAAMGIISKLPAGYDKFTRWLLDAEALTSIVRFLTDARLNRLSKNLVIENAVGALCFFTVPTNHEAQKRAAEAGVIPLLVQLLGCGTASTRRHAAVCLAQFSESSPVLSRRVEKPSFFFCCSTPPAVSCPVHSGICSVEATFCLLAADAVRPLVKLLQEADTGLCEAALRALSTLLEGDMLRGGSRVLSASQGVGLIIRLLSSQEVELQEKALRVLERIFQLEEHKKVYGASAQMPLVDIAQRGSDKIRALAARVLAHLDVLHDQSSYF